MVLKLQQLEQLEVVDEVDDVLQLDVLVGKLERVLPLER